MSGKCDVVCCLFKDWRTDGVGEVYLSQVYAPCPSDRGINSHAFSLLVQWVAHLLVLPEDSDQGLLIYLPLRH